MDLYEFAKSCTAIGQDRPEIRALIDECQEVMDSALNVDRIVFCSKFRIPVMTVYQELIGRELSSDERRVVGRLVKAYLRNLGYEFVDRVAYQHGRKKIISFVVK